MLSSRHWIRSVELSLTSWRRLTVPLSLTGQPNRKAGIADGANLQLHFPRPQEARATRGDRRSLRAELPQGHADAVSGLAGHPRYQTHGHSARERGNSMIIYADISRKEDVPLEIDYFISPFREDAHKEVLVLFTAATLPGQRYEMVLDGEELARLKA